jgi:hypothetical protein
MVAFMELIELILKHNGNMEIRPDRDNRCFSIKVIIRPGNPSRHVELIRVISDKVIHGDEADKLEHELFQIIDHLRKQI